MSERVLMHRMGRVIGFLAVAAWLSAGVATARDWVEDPRGVPEWIVGDSETPLGLTAGEILGYGDGIHWAEEVQVSFLLPNAPYGGPWRIEFVAFYMSGGEFRRVRIREGVDLETAPGFLLADDREIAPVDMTWPPSDWTYVPLTSGSVCPEYLYGAEGETFVIGIAIMEGDRIGLAAPEGGEALAPTSGWGYHEGLWSNDSADWGLTPAIRIGVSDLGLSPVESTTWGQIKRLHGSHLNAGR
jgi:hypothetical protein